MDLTVLDLASTVKPFFTSIWCFSLSQKVASNPIFQGDFHMEFCDNQRQLLQAYFRDFAVERLDRPWQAFTGSWSAAAVARNLGLNASFVGGRHSYVLVRLARHRAASRVTDDIQVGVYIRALRIVSYELYLYHLRV